MTLAHLYQVHACEAMLSAYRLLPGSGSFRSQTECKDSRRPVLVLQAPLYRPYTTGDYTTGDGSLPVVGILNLYRRCPLTSRWTGCNDTCSRLTRPGIITIHVAAVRLNAYYRTLEHRRYNTIVNAREVVYVSHFVTLNYKFNIDRSRCRDGEFV